MKASEDGRAEAEFPQMELLESQDSDPEQPQGPGERRQPGSLQSSLSEEAGGSARNLPDEKKPPPPRPGPLAMPPLSLGYGAFRRLGSASREPPSPGAAWAEQPRDGEAATGAEQEPWAAPGEQPSGSWAPMELQVDVRVKPMGAAVGSQAPPPSPSTRFLTVPVPESPASLAHPLSSTEGQGSPLAVGPTERGSDAKGRAVSPGSPTRRCRCKEHELDEEAVQLLRAGWDTKKLPRAMTLIGLPTYMKSLRWALAVMAVLLAVSTVVIVILASKTGGRCQPCPWGWIWSEDHCYYLSAEARTWEDSQAFCSAHHATLPLLSHAQDFLSRYPITKHSWLGARRGPQGWYWTDGVPLPPQLLPEEDDPAVSCGSLEEGRLVAVNCSSPRPWVCTRHAQ
ncbi:killer cell lectin-like receptor subfamily G member 2 [Ochotona curzoniae]|uniref:killer cell lectin-like receptor subfamily G member 2 n=1 Tax=Ochotona curzoniae TaxID=130825 RepID=UPI001B352F51|nr:killer cell lectin-like receptor subfamily G member 2 [Ochotona curzoniae]XP_040858040.1 killer cell lectin-like receptor subfamily G member 2 [Ochotona curzoniae]